MALVVCSGARIRISKSKEAPTVIILAFYFSDSVPLFLGTGSLQL